MRRYLTFNAVRVFGLLFFVDCIFVLLHIILKATAFNDQMFNLARDGSYPEYWQYFKETLALLFLGLLAWKQRSRLYLGWCLTFLYLLLDDALLLHENVGAGLAGVLHLPKVLGMRSIDLGELAVYGVVAVPILALLGLGYRAATRPEEKAAGRVLFGLLMALSAFGAGVDVLHSILSGGRVANAIFGLIEEGGEQLIITLIVVFVFVLTEFALQAEATQTAQPVPV